MAPCLEIAADMAGAWTGGMVKPPSGCRSGSGGRSVPGPSTTAVIDDNVLFGRLSVCRIGYRQLDYWARTSLIEPSIRPPIESGSSRLYSSKDILMLTVIKRLLDTGISMQQIHAAINHLSSRNIADLARVTLLSDGRDVYECVSPDEVVDLLQGGQGVFVVALTRVWQEVCHELTELPSVDVISGLIRPRSPRDWSEGDDFQS